MEALFFALLISPQQAVLQEFEYSSITLYLGIFMCGLRERGKIIARAKNWRDTSRVALYFHRLRSIVYGSLVLDSIEV